MGEDLFPACRFTDAVIGWVKELGDEIGGGGIADGLEVFRHQAVLNI